MSNPGCWQGNHTGKFSALLANLELPRKAIAAGLGIPYNTFGKYVCGYISFPPDLIPRLYLLTMDRRLIEFFAKPCGFLLQLDKKFKRNPRPPISGPDGLIRAAFRAWEVLRNAFDDEILSPNDRRSVQKAIDALIDEAQDIDIFLDEKIEKGPEMG